ncbi:heparan sulfate glucosamine 3-O-sulfotransferase 1-like [Glandiceps talaboti]
MSEHLLRRCFPRKYFREVKTILVYVATFALSIVILRAIDLPRDGKTLRDFFNDIAFRQLMNNSMYNKYVSDEYENDIRVPNEDGTNFFENNSENMPDDSDQSLTDSQEQNISESYQNGVHDNEQVIPDNNGQGLLDEWKVSSDEGMFRAERWRVSCYYPANPYYRLTKLRNESGMNLRVCEQRLPDVIIAGVRKCGTGSLAKFLNYHPYLVSPRDETHYFDTRSENGLDWYKSKMAFASRHQLQIEKTPTYFFRPFDAPKRIRQTLSSDVKIIVVVCDPVRRLVSDYVEFSNKSNNPNEEFMLRKGLADTIEETVFERSHPENVDMYNEMVDVGLYVKHYYRWSEYFSASQMLFVDGDNFRRNPTEELQRVEFFLGIRRYFKKEHFYFDKEKGQQCVAFPEKACMPRSKGRQHPKLADWAKEKLCEFYRPYDHALCDALNRTFTWVDQNC